MRAGDHLARYVKVVKKRRCTLSPAGGKEVAGDDCVPRRRKVPGKRYPRCTLDQFTLWDDILCYSVTKKDGSVHFCLAIPQPLKKSALRHAHVKSGLLGQKKTLTMAENLFCLYNIKSDVCVSV